jgi:hypothetical protein
LEIKEPLVPVFWNVFRIKEPSRSSYLEIFKNQRTSGSRFLKILKELVVFMRQPAKNRQFYRRLFDQFLTFLRTAVIY